MTVRPGPDALTDLSTAMQLLLVERARDHGDAPWSLVQPLPESLAHALHARQAVGTAAEAARNDCR